MIFSVENGMSVRRFGRGDEIVWVHGLGESSVSFEPIARHAALAGFAHTLVDLPGYGRSAWLPSPEGLVDTAERLAAWLRPTRPIVVGHSMGGVLATMVAERGGARGIVDIDGNLTKGDCTFSLQATADPDAERALEAIRRDVYARGTGEVALRGYHAALCFASPAQFRRHAVELVAASEANDLGPRLAKLAVPHLFVAGVPDGICAASRKLLDELGARWVGIEPAGHWVYVDQPDRFAAEVATFAGSIR